jgi:hypothetical protein
MRDDIREILFNMDLGDTEHTFILDCLKAAVEYCQEQFESSDIDWLPAASTINLQDEADKFVLLKAFLQTLEG